MNPKVKRRALSFRWSRQLIGSFSRYLRVTKQYRLAVVFTAKLAGPLRLLGFRLLNAARVGELMMRDCLGYWRFRLKGEVIRHKLRLLLMLMQLEQSRCVQQITQRRKSSASS